MFAHITARHAAEALHAANPWSAPSIVHDSVQTSWALADHPRDRLVQDLAEPAAKHDRVHGTNTEDTGVWHIAIGGITDIADLDDGECAAITHDVAAAAGFHDGDRPTTRWVAARSRQDHTLHLIASTVGNNDEPLRVETEHVHHVCREIETRIHDQNHAPLEHIGADDLDHEAVVIRDNPELGIAHTLGADNLAELILSKTGFRSADLGAGFRAWRTPYGAGPEQRAHIASTALDLLSAVGYRVSIQTSLLTNPRPDHDIGRAERRIADLTEQLDFCFDADDVAEATTEIDATLRRTTEFTRALSAWSDQRLDDGAYSARLAEAATLLDRAAAIINRDPAEAPAPRPSHMVTRAATTSTTARPGPATTPAASAPLPAGEPPLRRTR
ncbi:hypothetical protein [Embleya sp. NPDC020630]|uniref:hypothetical protein n=1 Tax=Embleya sp. NPDC020630 TaxID=3363979 RepID=UPI0037ABCF70